MEVVRGSPPVTELCPLHFERRLEYWLAEARVDATAKVTTWGVKGGVLIGERSCFQKKPAAICSRSSLFAVVALLTAVASTHLPVWKFPPPFVSTSLHQRAFLSFFFSTPVGKKKVTKDETQQEKKNGEKNLHSGNLQQFFFFLKLKAAEAFDSFALK